MKLWQGPSCIDGQPIALFATGWRPGARSRNGKTGPMIQTWIQRVDMQPTEAARSGCDASVCGDCPRRPTSQDAPECSEPAVKGREIVCPASDGWTTCAQCGLCQGSRKRARSIVIEAHGARARSGGCYVIVGNAPQSIHRAHGSAEPATIPARHLNKARVRLGAYGDPTAAPLDVWLSHFKPAQLWSGYTHQWRTCDQRWSRYLMASVDSLAEAKEAWALGWRTFRVIAAA